MSTMIVQIIKKWETEYLLIKKYKDEHNKWEDDKYLKYENE